MPATLVPAIIPAGGTMSEPADLRGGIIKRLRMPPDWNLANVTFQVATTNVPEDFRNVYARGGGEVEIAVVPGGVVALTDFAEFAEEAFLRIRSGTAALPIPQEAERKFEFVVVK